MKSKSTTNGISQQELFAQLANDESIRRGRGGSVQYRQRTVSYLTGSEFDEIDKLIEHTLASKHAERELEFLAYMLEAAAGKLRFVLEYFDGVKAEQRLGHEGNVREGTARYRPLTKMPA